MKPLLLAIVLAAAGCSSAPFDVSCRAGDAADQVVLSVRPTTDASDRSRSLRVRTIREGADGPTIVLIAERNWWPATPHRGADQQPWGTPVEIPLRVRWPNEQDFAMRGSYGGQALALWHSYRVVLIDGARCQRFDVNLPYGRGREVWFESIDDDGHAHALSP